MRAILVLSGLLAGFALVAPIPASAGPGAGGGYKDRVQAPKKKRRKKSEVASAVVAHVTPASPR